MSIRREKIHKCSSVDSNAFEVKISETIYVVRVLCVKHVSEEMCGLRMPQPFKTLRLARLKPK